MHAAPRITSRLTTPPTEAQCLPGADSHHSNLGLGCIHGALIVNPLKLQAARLRRHGRESEVGIGRDSWMPVSPEDLHAVIGARERVDDVAWDELAIDITAMAGLHGMGDQRFHLDDLALLGRAGDAHTRLCHGHTLLQLPQTSSTQAPSVTTMLAESDLTEPSLISAKASTVCDRARRRRVLISALPARHPR